MLATAKTKARSDRASFLALPGLEEGMDELRATVERENRADHWVDLGGCHVDYLGQVVAERDLRSGVEMPRLVPSETGLQRLAAFAPKTSPAACAATSTRGPAVVAATRCGFARATP